MFKINDKVKITEKHYRGLSGTIRRVPEKDCVFYQIEINQAILYFKEDEFEINVIDLLERIHKEWRTSRDPVILFRTKQFEQYEDELCEHSNRMNELMSEAMAYLDIEKSKK